MKGVTVEGSRRYDGEHPLDLALLTPRDYGLVKRLTGYVPADVPEGLGGYDLELICAIAVVALRTNGKVGDQDETEARAAYDELTRIVGGSVKLDLGTDDVEDDAVPPVTSSPGNGGTPGRDSKTSSATSPIPRGVGGTRDSGSSESKSLRSVS